MQLFKNSYHSEFVLPGYLDLHHLTHMHLHTTIWELWLHLITRPNHPYPWGGGDLFITYCTSAKVTTSQEGNDTLQPQLLCSSKAVQHALWVGCLQEEVIRGSALIWSQAHRCGEMVCSFATYVYPNMVIIPTYNFCTENNCQSLDKRECRINMPSRTALFINLLHELFIVLNIFFVTLASLPWAFPANPLLMAGIEIVVGHLNISYFLNNWLGEILPATWVGTSLLYHINEMFIQQTVSQAERVKDKFYKTFTRLLQKSTRLFWKIV